MSHAFVHFVLISMNTIFVTLVLALVARYATDIVLIGDCVAVTRVVHRHEDAKTGHTRYGHDNRQRYYRLRFLIYRFSSTPFRFVLP